MKRGSRTARRPPRSRPRRHGESPHIIAVELDLTGVQPGSATVAPGASGRPFAPNVVVLAGTVAADPVTRRMPSGDEVADLAAARLGSPVVATLPLVLRGTLGRDVNRAVVFCVLMLSACTADAPASVLPSVQSSSTAPTSGPPDSFVRTCRSSVYGTLGHAWRKDSVVLGPIAFVGLQGLATASAKTFDRPVKILAVVSAGAPVTVQVTAREPGAAALLYDLSKFNAAVTVEAGDSAVTFVPCKPGKSPYAEFGASGQSTQFNGGFIVSGPECVAMDVFVPNMSPMRRWVAFGAASCES